MDPKRREEFRMSLNDLIGIKNSEDKVKRKEEFHDSLMGLGSPLNANKPLGYFPPLKKEYIVNPQPLSVDR